MRRNDRNAGSIKALVILALLAANIVVALTHHSAPSTSRTSRVENLPFSGRLHEAVQFDDASHP
jgi:hypothetical protein